MRVSVVGATGMAGTSITAEALTRGHTVAAWSRRPGALPHHERLSTGLVDLSTANALGAVLDGADAAVLAVRPTAGSEHLIAPWTTRFLDAAAVTGTRVLVVGGAAPLTSPDHPNRLVVDDPRYVPAAWRQVARASIDQLRACEDHRHDHWAYLSPSAVFEPGPRTGTYRRGTTRLLVDSEGVSRITPADLAIAVIDELENPGRDVHFTVGQTSAAG